MSNSKYDDDSFEDDLIREFGDKDEEESLSELESELRPKEENLGMQAPEEDYIFIDAEKDDFEIKPKKRIKRKKKTKYSGNTKLLLAFFFLIILTCLILDTVVIGYQIIYKNNIDIKPLLLYSEKPVIYENNIIIKKENDHIPIININNSSIDDINHEIIGVYNNYYINNPDYFRYDYSVNDNTISIVLIYRNKLQDEEKYTYKFKTYIISLNTLSLYNNKQVLAKFNLTLSDVHNKMRKDFQNTYKDLINKNYLDKSYSYNQLINDLELSNFTKEVNYYIENNKLYVYRSYNIYKNDKITTYFNEYNYKFCIK